MLKMGTKLISLTLLLALAGVHGWNNGLARTPPMGWLSWTKFACNIDCKNYPNECIDEKLYKDMVDHIVKDGYLALGYNTVNIDDCWSEKTRDAHTNRLVPDHIRFPNGIKSLVDYARGKGVQLGIYEDVGTATCAGYPGTWSFNGSVDYTFTDAETFTEWGVGSLKLDGCNRPGNIPYSKSYPEYTKAFIKLKSKIAYACSWPLFNPNHKLTDHEYEILRDNCNYWRNYDDISDSWRSVQTIIEHYRQNVKTFVKFHGPGGWFDPDMLIIGNDGLSYEQSKSQMAFWCLWSAPLLMSNDLRDVKPEMKAILQNKHLIAVNQDPLGIMGHVVITKVDEGQQQVWVKKLAPLANGLNPWVVLYFNQETLGVPAIMSHQLSTIIPELKADHKYDVHDLFADNAKIQTLTANQKLTLRVKTSGSVQMVKLVPV